MNMDFIITLSEKAAKCILEIYHQPAFQVDLKKDKSFLTQADRESHAIICEGLKKQYPDIPIISEESTEFHDFETRKTWEYFFLVDPLDGTKEFVHRNDEFTINIALIHHNEPILGVINVPALNVIYHAEKGKGAYKISENKKIKLPFSDIKKDNTVNVAVSRSHYCMQTENFLNQLEAEGKTVRKVSAGSALKFGLAAEGSIDIYPRFTPTMEWDTAAGHILINEAGKRIKLLEQGKLLHYNKTDLKNSAFIVQ